MYIEKCVTNIILFIVTMSTFSKTMESNTNRLPEIWLSGYEGMDSGWETAKSEFRFREQFQNFFVSKNRSDFIIYQDAYMVEFTCEADYPIMWRFPFPEQFMHTMIQLRSWDFRISQFDSNALEPINLQYKSILTFVRSVENFRSVNLSCSSTERKQQLMSSLHIFLQDGSLIEHQGKMLNVTLDSTSGIIPALILPCRPASPDLKVILEKELSPKSNGNSTWEILTISEKHLTFDPKRGFTLESSLGKRIFGLYKCTVKVDDDNDISIKQTKSAPVVYINVTDKSDKNSSIPNTSLRFEPKSILHGNATIRVKLSRVFPEIVCCTGAQGKLPNFFIAECTTQLQCQLIKGNILQEIATNYRAHQTFLSVNKRRDCYTEFLYHTSAVVICNGENIDFVDHITELFQPLAYVPMSNKSNRISKVNPKSDHELHLLGIWKANSLTQFETSSVVERATVNQKMMLTIGRAQSKCEASTDGYLNFIQDGPREKEEYNEVPVSPDDAITEKLVEYDREVYYEGESLIFMCFAIQLFYADGSHLRLNWRNGTKTVVKRTKPLIGSSVKFRGSAYMYLGRDEISLIFTESVIATKGMSSVDCWMPKTESSQWDKISKKLMILPSVLPKFVETAEESIYFYFGDNGKVLYCTVIEGLPFPNATATRDGAELMKIDLIADLNETIYQTHNDTLYQSQRVDMDKHLIQIVIHFPKIMNDHQGVYQCIARNVNGTATRTVKVFVIDKGNIWLPLSLGIAGILCLVLAVLGVKHACDQQIVRSLQAANNSIQMATSNISNAQDS